MVYDVLRAIEMVLKVKTLENLLRGHSLDISPNPENRWLAFIVLVSET